MLTLPRQIAGLLAVGLWVGCWSILATAAAYAHPAFYRDLDGAEKTWQLLESGSPARILSHDHFAGGARNSAGAERIVIAAAAGQSAMASCEVPPMPVLEELEARLWVKANRSGVQLALRVVLPRTATNAAGAHATALVRGLPYNQPGRWQQLTVGDLPKLLANEVRVMRAVPGAAVDPREAFVNSVVLVIPGDPDGVEILTDELEVDGILGATPSTPSTVNIAAITASAESMASAPAAGWRHGAVVAGDLAGQPAPSVRLEGTSLVVEGKLFTPRAIEWRGEPLKFLAERGFNAVRLAELPTLEQTTEARQYKLWFLCTPAQPGELARTGANRRNSERVLAWYLADEAAQANPDYFRRWAEAVREWDSGAARPIIIASHSQSAAVRKAADILLVEHPLGSRISASEFDQFLSQRRQLARPGTPLWISISTQLGSTASLQAAALSGQKGLIPNVDGDQLELLTHVAMTAGCRGFVLKSSSSLAETNAATRRRALQLECINQQLAVWEPWLAGGKVIGRIKSTQPSENRVRASACLTQVDYARLLVPLHPELQSDDQDATNDASTARLATTSRVFVVPGIPNSNRIFVLSPAELRPLEATRVAGGTSIVIEPSDNGSVLLTEDPQVIQSLQQQVTRNAANAARMQHQLAMLEIAAVTAKGRALDDLKMKSERAAELLTSATQGIRHSAQLLGSGHFDEAYRQAAQSRRTLFQAAREQRHAVPLPAGLASYPLGLCYDTLPEHAKFVRSLDKLRSGDNLLYGGDFEELPNLLEFGWHHVNHPLPGVAARAELSAITPRHGAYCLQLVASRRGATEVVPPLERKVPAAVVSSSALFHDPFQPVVGANHKALRDDSAPPSSLSDDGSEILPEAPVLISSPSVPIDGTGVIEITGWMRIPKPLVGSAEGLQIVDSLGGPELSVSAKETTAWQPFRMIRAAPEGSELKLAFLLTGLGSAQIDGVMVRKLAAPKPRRLPPVVITPNSHDGAAGAQAPRLYAAPHSQ